MTGPPSFDRRDYWRAVGVAFALAVVVLCLVGWPDIRAMQFGDPDDAMRLLEVRDWLAGQSWWDVSQHRLGGGTVFAMHWSRLVDLPLAAVIAMVTPIAGAPAATLVALTVVPLLTLFCTIALVTALTWRLAGAAPAQLAALLVPITGPIVAQMKPMRIDHHGWQIVLALAAVYALTSRPTWRSGALGGAALATLITISFEGLPFAAATVAIAAIAWAFDPGRRRQAVALVATLATVALVLHVATRGPGFWQPACDAMAPAWLGALIAAAIAFAAVTVVPGNRITRLALLAVPGVVAIGVMVWTAPGCLRGGPFGMLDPFIQHWWFEQIPEGLPIWKQRPLIAFVTFGLPLVGLIGAGMALHTAIGARRVTWRLMLAAQGCALLLALLVLRAGGTANALALPGAAVIVTALLARARTIGAPLRRVAATAGALTVAAPSLAFPVVERVMPGATTVDQQQATSVPACERETDVAALDELPRARLFAPLDIGPEILVRTPHEAIASGYHRNNARMHLVMAAFMGDPAAAHRAVLETRGDYIVGCPGFDETAMYVAKTPNGLWARLERGERFAWLRPVPIHGSHILAWRVVKDDAQR